jgi:hypothetical protein
MKAISIKPKSPLQSIKIKKPSIGIKTPKMPGMIQALRFNR